MHGFALVAALSLLQQPTNITADQIVEDVRKLSAAQDNDGRFAALTEMLRARNISFVVEPFKTDAPAKDRRTEGRNVVATFGGGAQEIVIGAHYDAVPLPDGTDVAIDVEQATFGPTKVVVHHGDELVAELEGFLA